MSWEYSENILVQNSAGNVLKDKLGWDVEFAYNSGCVDDKQDTDIVPVAPHVPNEPSQSEKITKALIPTIGSLLISLFATIVTIATLLLKHKGISKAENAKTYLNNNFKVRDMNTRYVGTSANEKKGLNYEREF